jgi:hypothetical protein
MIALREQETLKKNPRIWVVLLAFLAMQAVGCITIKRRTEVKKDEIRPQLESTEADLLASYNKQVQSVQSLQATVDLIPSTGTTYSGVIEEYHDVPGFILAERPATVRMIGQAPVVAKNIFDMVSDGKQFRIYIPSRNTFLVGPTALTRASNKPLENLRPQHVVEALFWPPLPPTANVLFEQFDFSVSRYYILTLLRQTEKSGTAASTCVFPACNCSGRAENWKPIFSIPTGNRLRLQPETHPRLTRRPRTSRFLRVTSTSGGRRTTTSWRSRFSSSR